MKKNTNNNNQKETHLFCFLFWLKKLIKTQNSVLEMEGDKVVSYSISFRRISSQCVWLSQKAVHVEIKSTPDLCIYFQNL